MRPERLIAGGRVALAVASLFAVWFDFSEPVRFVALTYGVLIAYVLYSLVTAALLWQAGTMPRHWPVVSHATDLACCALLIFCTEGPSSPFNSLFVFSLLSATLRWRARGTLWTAGVVMVAFLVSGVYFGMVLAYPEFDLRAFIIRGVYLIVLAALLHYVGTEGQRTLREMWGLAEWPHALPPDVETLTRHSLQYAADLMEAPRVILRWAETDTAGGWQATWDRGTWTTDQLRAPGPLVRDELRARAFLADAVGHVRTLSGDPGLAPLIGWHADEGGAQPYGAVPLMVAPLRGESCAGHLVVLDKKDATVDDLILAEIVADVIASRLDSFYLARRLRHAAAAEERIRLARDLHDGVLQSFTGVGLRLAAIHRLVATDAEAARVAVEDVQRVLASEQRSLRFFIQELRPLSVHEEDDTSLFERLRDLARLMELEWDLRVDVRVDPADLAPPLALAGDIYLIVREGLINAARHGNASRVTVTIDRHDARGVALTIADNGGGFPRSGHFTLADLVRDRFGPKTLRERIHTLSGDLSIESGPDGATLHIVLPRERAA